MEKNSDWRSIRRRNFTKIKDLALFLELDSNQLQEIDSTASFILNLPQRIAAKIEKGTLNDPILKQFLPLKEEKIVVANFSLDPVQDTHFSRSSKLLHKYEGRALVVATGVCAMHCRYCFRKNFPYEAERSSFDEELTVIQQDESIQEVLLSGGDPLSLSNSVLRDLLMALSDIQHVKRVRFHTRFPIGIPERIDDGFLSLLKASKKQIWVVIHANHPREFDDDIWAALKEIQKLGIPALNQSVLLKGVNDCPDIQQALCASLIDHGIMPYYLHQLDPVQGAHHFDVDEKKGHLIIDELQKRLPGYAVPKYVRELPGLASKTQLRDFAR